MPPKKRKLYVKPPIEEGEATETEPEPEVESTPEAEVVAPEMEAPPAVPTVDRCACGTERINIPVTTPEWSGSKKYCPKCKR